jgi:hypothetical protein
MRLAHAGIALVVTLSLGACSGESSTNGSGGSSTGGSSTGGSSTGGSNTGGGNTGGAAGSATGGAAGSATGGAAGSATGGTGGGGGVNPGCDPLCTSLVGANCTNGPTQGGCLLTCKALTSSSTCDTKADAYFNCVKGTTVECNALGDPVAKGCGIQYLQAINCATTENPNPAIVQPCSDYCTKLVAKACGANTTDECNSNCKWLGATGTGCDDEWSTYLTCANAANFVCIGQYGSPVGCGTQFKAYSDCIKAAGQ